MEFRLMMKVAPNFMMKIAPSGIQLDAKSILKGYLQSKFGLDLQDSNEKNLCAKMMHSN